MQAHHYQGRRRATRSYPSSYKKLFGVGIACFILLSSFTHLQAQSGVSKAQEEVLPGKAVQTTGPAEQPVMRAAAFLSQYLQHASVTGNEKPAGMYLAQLCRELGLEVRVFTDEDGSYNFAASLFPLDEQRPNIILLSHIDVVPATDAANWQYPPFSGAIAEGYVWGRGALDVKGMAIMQVMALEEIKRDLLYTAGTHNITLLFVSGEEAGGDLGAALVTERHFEELNPVLVVGEGGSGISGVVSKHPEQEIFCVSVGEKQGLWLELRHRLPFSGHGSVPPTDYASKAMVEALDRLLKRKQKIYFSKTAKAMFAELGRLEGGLRGFTMRHLGLFKPLVVPALRKNPVVAATVSNTITLTGIHTPEGSFNQIPQEMTATLDCRLLPQTDRDKFLREVKKLLGRQDIEVRVVQQTPPAGISPTGLYFSCLEQAIGEVYPGATITPVIFPAFTDNNYFRVRGVPVFGINPVFLGLEEVKKVHNTNERISLENLEKGYQVYKAFLGRFVRENALAAGN